MFSWSLLEIPCHIYGFQKTAASGFRPHSQGKQEKVDRLTYIHLPYQHMNLSVTKDMRNGKLSKTIGGSTTLILLTASCKCVKKEVFIIFISSQDSAEIPCTMPNVFFQDELQRNTISLSC